MAIGLLDWRYVGFGLMLGLRLLRLHIDRPVELRTVFEAHSGCYGVALDVGRLANDDEIFPVQVAVDLSLDKDALAVEISIDLAALADGDCMAFERHLAFDVAFDEKVLFT